MKITQETIKLLTDERGDVELDGYRFTYTDKRLYVKGDLNVTNSNVKLNTPSLFVVGTLDFTESRLKGIPEYSHIGGSLFLDGCKGISTIPKGVSVRGSFVARSSSIKKIEKNVIFGGNVDFSFSKIKKLPNGLVIPGSLDLRHTPIKELPGDLVVGGKLFVKGSKIKSIPSGVKLGGGVDVLECSEENILRHGERDPQRYIFFYGKLFPIMASYRQGVGKARKTIFVGRFSDESIVFDGLSYNIVKSSELKPGIFDLMKEKPIGNADRCASCGAYAVEGTQLCKKCENQKR